MKSFRYNARIQVRNLDISGSLNASSAESAIKEIIAYNFENPIAGESCRIRVWTEKDELTEKEVVF